MRFQYRWIVSVLTVAVLALAVRAWTGSQDREAPTAAPGAAALRVAIDAETGELAAAAARDKSTDDELAKMLSRSSRGLEPVHHQDGRVSVRLDGRFMSASVARINDDGDLERACVHTHEQLQDFLDGNVPAHRHPHPEVE